MPSANVGGRLPKGDANGLDCIAEDMIKDRKKIRFAVVAFDCSKVVSQTDDDEEIAFARIKRIEVVSEEDLPAMQRIMSRQLERRTGQVMLDFDTEEEIRSTLDSIEDESTDG